MRVRDRYIGTIARKVRHCVGGIELELLGTGASDHSLYILRAQVAAARSARLPLKCSRARLFRAARSDATSTTGGG